MPKVGDHIKVLLPGETPWALVLEVNGPLVKARIANKLFHEHTPEQQREWTGEQFGTAEPLPKLHDFKQGDEAWFERCNEYGCWQPVKMQ